MSEAKISGTSNIKGALINVIKFNPRLREVYATAGGIALKVIGGFLPINRRRVLFLSFGGRRFDDSPRAIYDAMSISKEFSGWDFVWAFSDKDQPSIPGARTVKVDSLEFFVSALTSRVWVTNTSITRGMRFKRKETISVNTWHGTPLKRMADYHHKEQVDILTSQNDVDEAYFRRKFDVNHATLLKCDLPRNDILSRYTDDDIHRIKDKIGIPADKKVILYMPTFRDYQRDEYNRLFFTPPIDFERWKEELGEEYVLLVRFHYMVEKAVKIPLNEFVFSVTDYPLLTDLYAITDIFISDYSSSYVDFSILGRPMFCYAYDYEQYSTLRGFEVDFEKALPCRINRTEDELLKDIKAMDWDAARDATEQFRMRFASHAGNATEEVIEELRRRLDIATRKGSNED